MKTSIDEVRELCDVCDIIFLQETWLAPHDLTFVNTLDGRFYSKSVSSILIEDRVIRGRPHGGLSILWSKQIAHMCKVITFDDCRILGIEIDSNNQKVLFLNVYLPYDDGSNLEEYLFYLHKINEIVTDYSSSYVYILGDFNGHCSSVTFPTTHRFGGELLQFCIDESYLMSDVELHSGDDLCTYYSEAHGTFSRLDHILSTVSAHSLIDEVWVKPDFVSSDHFPLCAKLKIDCINIDPTSSASTERLIHRIKWCDLSDSDRQLYKQHTDRLFSQYQFDHSMVLCDDVHCSDSGHFTAIDNMYNSIVSSLSLAGATFSNVDKPVFNQVEGWNEHCKQAHSDARESFLLWRSYNSPRHGPLYDTMRRTRSQFKLLLRKCKSGQLKKSSDSLAIKFLSKDCKSFWKDVKKLTSTQASIASTVNGVTGQANIANM